MVITILHVHVLYRFVYLLHDYHVLHRCRCYELFSLGKKEGNIIGKKRKS